VFQRGALSRSIVQTFAAVHISRCDSWTASSRLQTWPVVHTGWLRPWNLTCTARRTRSLTPTANFGTSPPAVPASHGHLPHRAIPGAYAADWPPLPHVQTTSNDRGSTALADPGRAFNMRNLLVIRAGMECHLTSAVKYRWPGQVGVHLRIRMLVGIQVVSSTHMFG